MTDQNLPPSKVRPNSGVRPPLLPRPFEIETNGRFSPQFTAKKTAVFQLLYLPFLLANAQAFADGAE